MNYSFVVVKVFRSRVPNASSTAIIIIILVHTADSPVVGVAEELPLEQVAVGCGRTAAAEIQEGIAEYSRYLDMYFPWH